MLELLNVLFRSLSPLWEMSVTAAYAAAVVIVLRLLLKKRAPKQVLCLLWLVVFARLLIPASLESPLSIVPNALPGQEHIAEQASAGPGAGTGAEDPVIHDAPQDPVHNQPQNQLHNQLQNQSGNDTVPPVVSNPNPPLSVPEGVSPADSAPEAPVSFPWQAVIAGVWLTGAAALGGYALVASLRLRRRLFDAIRAEDGAWEHPAVGSPFILGTLRPKIYLPAGLTGQPRQFILCHERAHLRRFDHIVKPVCWLALTLHWFNPLAWAAFLLMSRDIEAACDEAVVRQLGSTVKADYSYTLLALATGRRFPAPCSLAFDEGDAGGRIQNVLNYRRPAFWAIGVSVIAAALAAVCLLTDPVAAKESKGDPDPGAAASQNPGATVSQSPANLPGIPQLDPWMEEILGGKRTFFTANSHDNDRAYSINDLRTFYFGDDQFPDAVVELDRLAILDLDRDGVNEMIISPAGDDEYLLSNVGYLVLRRQGDAVYGYNPPYRGFNGLKADGTFYWSNSAFESGIASMTFEVDRFELNNITWSTPTDDLQEELYFVDGREATWEEFCASFSAQDAKPDPAWYRWYEDTGLLPVVVTSDQSTFTPGVLGDGMQELYRQASYFYYHLFGESTAGICDLSSSYWSSGWYDPMDTVERDGLTYVRVTGQFARWADLMAAADALFTRDFWDACNTWDGRELFINVDGNTYFLPASRVSGDYFRGADLDPFTLVEQTDTSVTLTLTVGYNRCRAGEDEDQWSQRTSRGFDYTVDYAIRLVKTENGWRFDEFHYARTDHRGYMLGHILWQTDPLYAINGWMDEAILRQEGPDVFLDWDGITYQIETDVCYSSFTGRMYVLDVDGDGQTEASLVYLNGEGSPVIAVYERTGNGLQRRTFDTGRLLSWFDSCTTVERDPEGGLTLIYRAPGDDNSMELSGGVFEGYEWLQEGEIYAKMDPGFFYVGLASEAPLTLPFSTHSFIKLSDGVGGGPCVASVGFRVEYDGSGFTIGKLWWEPYAGFAAVSAS